MKQTRLLLPGLLLALVLPFALRTAQAIEMVPFSSTPPIVVKGDMVFGTPMDATGGAGTAWGVQTADYHSSPSAMQSGAVGNEESTTLAAKITGSGKLSFWWSVSSEQGYDKLTFAIDETDQESISGDGEWEKMEYTVSGNGDHYLTWTYSKDVSRSFGADCGWLDDVSWEPDGGQNGGQQTMELTTGWNWVGFRVLPQSHKVGDVLGTSGFTANDLIQTSGGMSRFNGTGWLPSAFTVDYGRMYQLYTAKALTLNIRGSASASSDTTVVSGWNWMSNPTARAVTPAELVHSGGWTAGDRIQSSNRTVTYTGSKWLPSTGFTLEPGQGSQLFTARDGRVSFGQGEVDDELYVVVDLSGGPDATDYPVWYSATGPDLSDDTCRTTELWLRRIPAGTFTMGSPENEMERDTGETQHQVTLTQDYYIGVFECTQRQWELVMGTRPSYFSNADYYATRPVEKVSYDMIRGTGEQAGAGWPACGHTVDDTSFMGVLQAKTGLVFDLPTEAQWEHACRAGTTTALNSGKDLTSSEQDDAMAEVGRYWYNGGSGSTKNCTTDKGTAKVGSYLPNAWGLYDMHGNVYEYCLDWYTRSVGAEAVSDPAGPDTGTYRVGKGGNWGNDACYCRSAFRLNSVPSNAIQSVGFRIACHPQAAPEEPDPEKYVVVDLSGGPNASSYPVRYSATGPDLSDDTCRANELWLRKIPAGTFIMGSPEDEVGRWGNETQHEVMLTQDYYIGVFECTQQQWEKVMGTSNPSSYLGFKRPVENVSYDMIRGDGERAGAGWPTYGHKVDAASFMGKLQAKTGLLFDLPTEAQWEYACRAGTTTALNSGKNLTSQNADDAMAEVGRYRHDSDDGNGGYSSKHTTVGSYQPNAWGLYDMHGNVQEWCLDWTSGEAYGTEAVTDPVGLASGTMRVLRGGYFNDNASSCRSAYSYRGNPIYSNDSHGFRIACHPHSDMGEPDPGMYAVVDLSRGPNASKYPVRYSSTGPDLSNDKCRTTELWLRKIPAGTFMMSSYGVQREVTLTQDYYIGVFECTQKQWELVMEDNPSLYEGDCRPVENVSYYDIRGTSIPGGRGWPKFGGHSADEDSFMGVLQAKTGLVFDLPTTAQWDYACRAGTTTDFNSGKNLTSKEQDPAMNEVGRYKYNQNDGKGGYSEHTKVGCYRSNAWGLYDMHGNVREWCLDDGRLPETGSVTDPVGGNYDYEYLYGASSRANYGGDWDDNAEWCSALMYDNGDVQFESEDRLGFRIAFHPRLVLEPVQDVYAVVDLSGGPNAASYPVRFTNTPPDLNDDTCRTTELWLRKVTNWVFTMGSPDDELGRNSDEEMHDVYLNDGNGENHYYIGVFECTQKQWELVMGDKPSYFNNANYYATRPVESVSYDMIRGTDEGAKWPMSEYSVDSTSFIGKLRAKTGLRFDLPTEAQWECASRAENGWYEFEPTTALNSGRNLTSTSQDSAMNEVGRYWYNCGSDSTPSSTTSNGTAKVGSYLPNVWGLYDMHGNVAEWCLDWYGEYDTDDSNPKGPSTGTKRVKRGGNWTNGARYCRSASRDSASPSNCDRGCGFRIVIYVDNGG